MILLESDLLRDDWVNIDADGKVKIRVPFATVEWADHTEESSEGCGCDRD